MMQYQSASSSHVNHKRDQRTPGLLVTVDRGTIKVHLYCHVLPRVPIAKAYCVLLQQCCQPSPRTGVWYRVTAYLTDRSFLICKRKTVFHAWSPLPPSPSPNLLLFFLLILVRCSYMGSQKTRGSPGAWGMAELLLQETSRAALHTSSGTPATQAQRICGCSALSCDMVYAVKRQIRQESSCKSTLSKWLCGHWGIAFLSNPAASIFVSVPSYS